MPDPKPTAAEKQREHQRRYRANNRACLNAKHRTYKARRKAKESPAEAETRRSTESAQARTRYEADPETFKSRTHEWKKANREKRSAQDAVKWALRSGRLTRPENCERCEVACKPHGHHADHRKKLEVAWLCAACHAQEHAHG